MKQTVVTLALAAALVVPGAVLAQDAPPTYIWINAMKAQAGQSDSLTGLTIEEDGKTFNPLVDEGSAYDWGLAMPVIHDGGDAASHYEWISFAGWAGADAFMAKFMEGRQAMSEDDKADMMAKWEGAVVAGSHADAIWEVEHMGSSDQSPSYINIGYYTANPGMAGDVTKFYKKMAAPVYDKLLADGTIVSYGVATPALHRGQGATHMGWFSTPNLAARDKVFAAFEAADAERSEEENKEMGEFWQKAFDPAGHTDEILVVVHHYGGSGDGE